ncbi:hypothetical protein DFH08DRAFT_1039128 [Mycena albidolilacea]|uniref:Uncharacterized protein n=1 Tax=Mycena albidolilacea TaxID=1033008 RepID=A0AAD7AIX1_9AGAR|nr:hypothetical protein DFH08DRAFT_1039128 [Mycena albidolilacea]
MSKRLLFLPRLSPLEWLVHWAGPPCAPVSSGRSGRHSALPILPAPLQIPQIAPKKLAKEGSKEGVYRRGDNRIELIRSQTLSDFLCIHTHGHMVIYAFTIESLYTVLHPSLLMLYSPIPSVDDQPSEVLCHTAVVLGDRLGVAGSSGSTLLGEEVPETGASNADSSTSSAAPMSSAACTNPTLPRYGTPTTSTRCPTRLYSY